MPHRETMLDSITNLTPKSQPKKGWFLSTAEKFREARINSLKSLIDHYCAFSRKEKFVAICLFMKHRYQKSLPILFREVIGRDKTLAGAASGALAMIGGDNVLKRIVNMLSRKSCNTQRLLLVNALAMSCSIGSTELWVQTLLKILETASEEPECRMSAAEGIANALYAADKRTKLYRSAISILLTTITDNSPDVRACSSFALGQLQEKQAINILQQLSKNDQAVCSLKCGHPGIWTVGMEANEAIKSITRTSRLE